MNEQAPSKEQVEKPYWVPDNALRIMIRQCEQTPGELQGLASHVLKGICMDLLDRRTAHEPPAEQGSDFVRDLAAVNAIRNGYQVSDSNRVLLSFIDNLWREYSRASQPPSLLHQIAALAYDTSKAAEDRIREMQDLWEGSTSTKPGEQS